MEVLFEDTYRLLSETQGLLQELLSSHYGGNKDYLEAKIDENKSQLSHDLERLKTLVAKQPPQYRQEGKGRLDQVMMDFTRLTQTLDGYNRRKYQMEEESRQREELLSTRFARNESSDHTAIPLEHAVSHNTSLRSAHGGVDQLLDIASSSLSGMRDQYGILKRARTTILDVSSTLGLSNTVMRLIERRTAQDRYIFWTGVIITIVIIFLVLKYFL